MSEQQFEVRESAPSPLADALMRVGDRWTLLIVQALLAGPRRFNELLEYIPGIAANILSQRQTARTRSACGITARYCPTCDHLVEDEPELEMQFL
jgi:hypothetical protein